MWKERCGRGGGLCLVHDEAHSPSHLLVHPAILVHKFLNIFHTKTKSSSLTFFCCCCGRGGGGCFFSNFFVVNVGVGVCFPSSFVVVPVRVIFLFAAPFVKKRKNHVGK